MRSKWVKCQAHNQWVNLMPHATLLFGLLRSLPQKGAPHAAQVTQALKLSNYSKKRNISAELTTFF